MPKHTNIQYPEGETLLTTGAFYVHCRGCGGVAKIVLHDDGCGNADCCGYHRHFSVECRACHERDDMMVVFVPKV
jgi:hypothetical protein